MDTLHDYLISPGAKRLSQLAAEVGVSPSRLSQLRHAVDWPPEIALKIEAATGGGVNASHVSPLVAKARDGLGE